MAAVDAIVPIVSVALQAIRAVVEHWPTAGNSLAEMDRERAQDLLAEIRKLQRALRTSEELLMQAEAGKDGNRVV